MADDAFAISPISARAAQPSDADYGAIRDAFMETARGRWFLEEYAKRNRNADTTTVLEAVARLEAGLALRTPDSSVSTAAIVDAIRPLIAEARATIDRLMTSDELEAALNGGRRGARIIREISWSLRETGTDPRICNILDEQLLAIETLHERHAADPRREQISEAFDDLTLQVEAIAADGIDASAATTTTTVRETLKQPPLKQDPVEQEPVEQDSLQHERDEPQDDAAVAVSVEADSPAAESESAVVSSDAVNEPSFESEPLGSDPLDSVSWDSPSLESSASENALATTPAWTLTEDEIAADDAVLGLIATEMAMDEDDGDDFDSNDAIAELRDLAASAAPSIQAAAPAASAPPMMRQEAVEPASPTASSLGAALIANGVVRQPQRSNDPLAAFRRMSQIEKIAFFS
jgi:hypothetical protein